MTSTDSGGESGRRERLALRRRSSRGIDANRLWWGGFIIGSSLIMISAWVPMPWFYIVGLVAPLSVLLGYAWLGWNHIRKTEDQAQFADSVYYLGFLFTLVTLAFALIFLATSADWEQVPLAQLIARFGLALGTTIVGLAIRVAWVNTLKSMHDARTNSEQALVMAADDFRLQLQASTEAFQTLNETYMEEMQKSVALSSKTYEEHAHASEQSLNASLDRVSDAIDVSTTAYTDAFEKKMAKLALPDEWIRRAVTAPINSISESLESVSAELKKVLVTQKLVAVDSDRLADNYSGIADSLEPLARVTETVGGLGTRFEEVSRTLTTFVQAFEVRVANTDERMVKLSETIGKLEGSVSSLTSAMGEAGNSSKSLTELANVAQKHKLELEVNLAASRESLQSLHQEILGAAQLVTRKLGNS